MNLRFLFGDQLNLNISSLSDIDAERDEILMCEVWDEATYVKHHKKKIAFIFSAMRHFANELKGAGYNVRYKKLDSPDNLGSFRAEIESLAKTRKPKKIIITEPSEYRVLEDVKTWNLKAPLEIRPDDRFFVYA